VATLRVKKGPYTYVVLDKMFIDTPGLSWKAKGLLAYLLARPDNWEIRESDLVAHATDGRDSVRTALRELKAAGFIVKAQRRSEVGKFSVAEFDVYERPCAADSQYILVGDYPSTEKPSTAGSKARQRVAQYKGPFRPGVGEDQGEYE